MTLSKAAVQNRGGRANNVRKRRPRDADGWLATEKAFVLHYLGVANRNATEAAVLAGYGRGNRDSAKKQGCEILQRPHVIEYIDKITQERNQKLRVTADDVLRELMILKVDAETEKRTLGALKMRREILKDIGDHVAVGAFRRNVGLSAPNGGPIEVADLAMMAELTDDELDQLEKARAILDRISPASAAGSDRGSDSSGTGATPQGE